MSNGWIGVDLDGTLAHYDSWTHHTNIGVPIQPMVNRVREWLVDGQTVKIFTARMSVTDDTMREEIAEAIREWTYKYIGQALEATCAKDLNMLELWDDRAVQVVYNTGERVGNVKPRL